jgi:hypothetical protein
MQRAQTWRVVFNVRRTEAPNTNTKHQRSQRQKDSNDKKIQTTKRFKRQKDHNDKKITITKRSQRQKDHNDKKIQTTKRSHDKKITTTKRSQRQKDSNDKKITTTKRSHDKPSYHWVYTSPRLCWIRRRRHPRATPAVIGRTLECFLPVPCISRATFVESRLHACTCVE